MQRNTFRRLVHENCLQQRAEDGHEADLIVVALEYLVYYMQQNVRPRRLHHLLEEFEQLF